MNLEKFKVEWKQRCDLWGPMSHRSLLQSNASSRLAEPTPPGGVLVETLDWNKMLICTAKCKERTLPVQEGRPLHHTVIKYSASFYFSNSLTTRVYLFYDKEFLTLAPLWRW